MTKPSKPTPKKPWPSFPLFLHPNGQWAKKIRGKHHYFGTDANAAHDEYIRVAADLHEGRLPDRRRDGGTPTVKELVNRFLNDQIENLKGDRIHANWFDESARVAADFAEQVGKDRPWDDLTPDDFGQYRSYLYDRWSPPTIRRRMTIVRQVFTHAVQNELIPRPARYGNRFDKPTELEMRRHKNRLEMEQGARLFERDEVRALLDNAKGQLRAMILLGINGGYYASDCAALPVAALDFERGVSLFPRHKTEVRRTLPLWPETVDAVSGILNGVRPVPSRPGHRGLVFLTQRGNPWRTDELVIDPQTGKVVFNTETDRPKVKRNQGIAHEFAKLMDRTGLRRHGRGFGTLRHTFRTWADEQHDQNAVDHIMGHELQGSRRSYIQRFELRRLRAVTDSVRAKLFG